MHFCCSLKNLLVLIYSKLYSKLPILREMKRNKTFLLFIYEMKWFVYFNLSQSETELQVVVKNSCVYNKQNYYNLYYAYITYIEFWLITKYILRIFISDEIPKSNCVVWDLRLTFISQFIWLIQPHSTVLFYNIMKWVIGLDAVS